MQIIEVQDELGRKYKAQAEGDLRVILGPPEGLVDSLALPEPLASRLHNILYERGILNLAAIKKTPNALAAALQEALLLDAQKLTEAFMKFETEVRP